MGVSKDFFLNLLSFYLIFMKIEKAIYMGGLREKLPPARHHACAPVVILACRLYYPGQGPGSTAGA
jgi:hypothetical protein